jgi:hypothetical protein
MLENVKRVNNSVFHRRQNMTESYENIRYNQNRLQTDAKEIRALSRMNNVCKRKLKFFPWGGQNIVLLIQCARKVAAHLGYGT